MGIAFYFGAMSPYSWFAAERIELLLPDARWCPVFAGGLFKAHARTSWGLTGDRSAKVADCEARAQAYGLGPIRWPDPWPTNDVLIARAMMFAQRRDLLKRFALTAMRMAFVEGVDLGELTAVREVAERTGLGADAIVEAVGDPEVKQAQWVANEEAVGLGVFGVPTVAVDTALFWGDDRLLEASRFAGMGTSSAD